MKVLIAEDDPIYRRVLLATLAGWGYETEAVQDGITALTVLSGPGAPPMAILDWIMPGLEGIDVCRRLRALPSSTPVYVIVLTARDAKEDLVAGLEGGANDYLTKPFNREELRARLIVGQRHVELQHRLAERVRELEEALGRIKQLQGLLPICCYCKKIRDDKNYWQQVETYISAHSDTRFSHGICPECFDKVVRPELEKLDALPPPEG